VSTLSVVRTASGGVLRHKVQAFVLCMVLLVSTASATLGLALLEASNGPFNSAFAAQQGADITLSVNANKATAAQLAASEHATGVTAAAGPFTEVSVALDFQGQPWGTPSIVGRAAPGGSVDTVDLSAGHWADGPGQIVIDARPGLIGGPGGALELGSTFQATSLPGRPVLTVVGFATSITRSAFAWVTPAEATALRSGLASASGATPPNEQMLYRFASAGGDTQIRTDQAALTKVIPAASVLNAANWLTQQSRSNSTSSIMEPFVVAFALIGLIMAVLIVSNVVSGAVVAQYHRIGVLKSLGMTPGQVIAVYLNRIGWPSLVGCVLGVVLGALMSGPVLGKSAGAYGVGRQTIPPWVLLAAPLGMLALTMLAAFGPALRAGRLSATEAIAAGHAPKSGHGYLAHRLLSKVRVPRPISLGLAAPFARPTRTVVTLFAIAFGACAVIFAVGLSTSLGRVQAADTQSATVPVVVQEGGSGNLSGPDQTPSSAQDAAVTAALAATPGAAHTDIGYAASVTVPSLPEQVQASVFSGESSWQGWTMITGHWFTGPGQIVVNTEFLDDSGLSVGDTTTVNTGTTTVSVKIVGEYFNPSTEPDIWASAQALPGVATPSNLAQWNIGLRPGTSMSAYISGVNKTLGSSSPWAAVSQQGGGQFFSIASALIALLSLMVAIASGLGVLNTVLMTTRDKVHDLGIFKAIGMRPGQVLAMVCCWVLGPAIIAAVLAAPAAVELNTATLHAMANAAHTGIPGSLEAVFSVAKLALLSLAALAIAALGALLPASWAARARPAVALRSE
jgi:putative ABC transport system permease protein